MAFKSNILYLFLNHDDLLLSGVFKVSEQEQRVPKHNF